MQQVQSSQRGSAHANGPAPVDLAPAVPSTGEAAAKAQVSTWNLNDFVRAEGHAGVRVRHRIVSFMCIGVSMGVHPCIWKEHAMLRLPKFIAAAPTFALTVVMPSGALMMHHPLTEVSKHSLQVVAEMQLLVMMRLRCDLCSWHKWQKLTRRLRRLLRAIRAH